MKRVLSLVLALVMLLSFAACGKDDGGEISGGHAYTEGYDETKYNAPGEFPIFKEKQTITVMLPDSVYVEDWDTNYQTTLMEERLNADLVISAMPSKEYNTKISLMAASGGNEFKDAILGTFSDERVMTLGESGTIIPTTDYIYNKDIAYYINEGIERVGFNFLPQVTMPDGEIYGVPNYVESISNMNATKMWIYKPWFDKFGIDVDEIKTRDDFKAAMNTVVKGDPNGNGKSDEVGIASAAVATDDWIEWLMNSFIYAGGKERLVVEDGKLSFAYTHDEWREGLKFIKSMYDDGLISPLSFTQDTLKNMINANETIVTAFCSAGPGGIESTDPRRVEYYGIQPLNSDYNDGKPLANYNPPVAGIRFMISARAADKENTFRFGDYMTSVEIGLNQRYGREGVDWFRPTEKDKSLYDSLGYPPYLIEGLPWSTKQNSHWVSTGPIIRELAVSAGIVWSGNPLDHNRVIAEAQIRYENANPKEYVTKLIFTEEEREISTEALATLETYVNEMAAKFITGAANIDAEWDNFQTQIQKIGAEDVLECAQASYDRMNGNK